MKKSSKILIGIGITLFIVILALVIMKFSYNFELKGKKTVEINYNEEYKEGGYSYKIFGKDFSKKVKVSNNINNKKIGTYQVKYTYKIGFMDMTIYRNVKVVDKIKPVIELTGEMTAMICPNSKYKEEGYKAYDEYDKDLTDKVVIEELEDKIKYSVKDSSDNIETIIREIKHEDNKKPKINLKGNTTVYLPLNSNYKESGYTVTDNCNPNLTDKVKVTNNVDITKTGTYKIKYEVSDDLGNKTEKTRIVYVYDPSSFTSASGIIYLTFDDGPTGSGSTSKILNILKEEGIKATFFVTSNGPDNLIKREYEEGHTVALHTYTHDFKKIYSSTDNYFNDLYKIQNRVKKITGEEAVIMRFPGGTSNTVSRKYKKGIMTELNTLVKEKGFISYDWNVDSNDAGNCAKSSTKDKKNCVYKYVTNNLSKKRTNIVLMHDIKTYTADALRDIIRYAKANGYVFDKLTPAVTPYTFRPNN